MKILEKFKNKEIYLSPNNELSQKLKIILDENINYSFKGFLDKKDSNNYDEIYNCIVIVSSPNFYREITKVLKTKSRNSVNLYYSRFNKHDVKIYKSIVSLIIYYRLDNFLENNIQKVKNNIQKTKKSLLLKLKNNFRIIKNYLYQKTYFLPIFILEYFAKKDKYIEELNILKKLKADSWLKKNKNLHDGGRCFIIATGPSLNQLDLSKIKNEYTIGVNGIYKIADPINLDYYIYVSEWYWKYHIDGIKNLKCKRKFLPIHFSEYLNSNNPTSWINILRPRYYTKLGYKQKVPIDFSLNPHEFFYAGGTVIFLALQLAYYLGFKEVIILGLDHTYRKDDYKNKKHGGYFYNTTGGDNAHFDQEYTPEGVDVHVDLEAMEHGYVIAKNIFEKSGRKILNASPNTMLDIFEKIEYDKLF